MDQQTFRDRFPEFDETTSELVAATLAEAALEISSETYGAEWDAAHGLLTAHKLWSSPFGITLRMDGDPPDGSSKYKKAFDSIKKAATVPLTFMVL